MLNGLLSFLLIVSFLGVQKSKNNSDTCAKDTLVVKSHNFEEDSTNSSGIIRLECSGKYNGTERNPAWFVDERFFPSNSINSINPEDIENINIVKRDTTINGINYYGQVFIELKKDIEKPDFVCLTEFDGIYEEILNKPTIYTIDGELVEDPYTRLIDKKSILEIEVNEVGKVVKDTTDVELQIVNVITKSEENIKERNTIRIR